MTELVRDLTNEYISAVEAYLAGAGEVALVRAYEVGRLANEAGLGLLDIAAVHRDALQTILSEAATVDGTVRRTMTAASVFAESLAPFEMTHRGFREANEALRRMNEELDARVQQQTAELVKANQEFNLVYAHVSDVVFYLGVEPGERFRFLSVNPAFLRATGLAASQVVGKLMQEVVPEFAHALVLSNYREAIHDKKTVRWEEVSVYPAGTKYGEVAVTPIFDADGRCTNLVGTVHDITERRQAEEQIRRLNAELEQRVIERTAQLEATNKELEAFSYSVSHDLRAPLRAIDGFSQILLEDYANRLDAQGADSLRRVRSASQLMGQLIDDLLMLSRVTRAVIQHERVDLSAAARAIAADLQKAHPQRRVRCRIAEGLAVEGDPRLLEIALRNLLDNAWKFTGTRAQATIEVGSSDRDGRLAFFVKDNGVGFDMAYADRLFGAFQRLHPVAEFEGTGIGLAIVQRIISRHGGRVWAEGATGEGATFYFTLQAHPAVGGA